MPVDKDRIKALAERIRQNGKVDVNKYAGGGPESKGKVRIYDEGDPEFIGPVIKSDSVVRVPAQRDNTATVFTPSTAYVTDSQMEHSANLISSNGARIDDNPMGFVPVVGDALQGGQALIDLSEGNYLDAALGAGLLVLPNIIEKPLKYVGKKAYGAAKKIMSKIGDSDGIDQVRKYAKKHGMFTMIESDTGRPVMVDSHGGIFYYENGRAVPVSYGTQVDVNPPGHVTPESASDIDKVQERESAIKHDNEAELDKLVASIKDEGKAKFAEAYDGVKEMIDLDAAEARAELKKGLSDFRKQTWTPGSPKEEVQWILDDVRSGRRPPLRTKIKDIFGEEIEIPEEFAAAMETRRFNDVYPNGVDFFWRGFGANTPDWKHVLKGYNALFGGGRDMAEGYTKGFAGRAEIIKPSWEGGNPNLLLMMVPKGQLIDLGDFHGAHWTSLHNGDPRAIDISDRIRSLYGSYKNKNKAYWSVANASHEAEQRGFDYGYFSNLADRLNKEAFDIDNEMLVLKRELLNYRPYFEGVPVGKTDDISDIITTNPDIVDKLKSMGKAGVILRNVDDGPVGNEIIYNPILGGYPKVVHPDQTYNFDLSEKSYLNDGGTLLRKYEDGGPEGEAEIMWDPNGYLYKYDKRALPSEMYNRIPLKNPNPGKYSDDEGIVGFYNINDQVVNGSARLYKEVGDHFKYLNDTKLKKSDPALYDNLVNFYRFYKNNDTGEIFGKTRYADPYLNLDNYTEISYDDVRKMMPKRDYIGGEGYRLNTAKRIPGFIEKISDRARAYGINPNLLLHRILREGFIDEQVEMYNNADSTSQKGFWPKLWDNKYSGFRNFGLDDAGSNLLSGKYSLIDPSVSWSEENAVNEQGRPVTSVYGDLKSMIEIKAAEMAYRQSELAKRGLTGDAYTNAAYNGGLNWDKLNDADYVKRYYSVPDYGVFDNGGNIHIKKSKRGTFTAAAKAHGKSVQAFASQVLANKDNYSPAMVKKANFARNAAKWHSDGGAINKAFDNGDLDVIRAAVNNVLSRKMSGK